MSTAEFYRTFKVGDDGAERLVVTLTDEGIVLDFYGADQRSDFDDPIATEAMTADEWVEWMLARRAPTGYIKPTEAPPAPNQRPTS